MRLRSRGESGPEHWSKDFVEHLRTVHFALTTVSMGLILLLTSKAYDAKTAGHQLELVETTSEKLKDGLQTMPGEPIELRDWCASNAPYTIWQLKKEDDLLEAISDSEHKKIIFHIQQPILYRCNSQLGYYENISGVSHLNRISAFASWWNTLPIEADLIAGISDIGEQQSATGKFDFVKIIAATDEGPSVELFPQGSICDFDKPRENVRQRLRLKGVGGEYSYTFSVLRVKRIRMQQSDFHYQPEGRTKSFEKTFPDLATAATDVVDDGFEAIGKRLDLESKDDSQPFEPFGIKFKSAQVPQWGTVVLLGVQVYLLIYLKRLWKKLKHDDPGWDTPWLAMDSSVLARLMLFLSMVLLPSAAATLIFLKAESQYSLDVSFWHVTYIFERLSISQRVDYVMIPLGCLVSIILGILCWVYRPRLAEQSAPSQTFENGDGI